MKVLNYTSWKKRKLVILKMMTSSNLIQSNLDMLGIPYEVYDCVESYDLEKRWESDRENVCGAIITGSRTVPEYGLVPAFPTHIIDGIPVLGICYGHEILGELLGSKIVDCNPPFGEHSTVTAKLHNDELFRGFNTHGDVIVTMTHDQMLDSLPEGSKLIAETDMTPIAGFHHEQLRWWGLQFHPEKDWMGSLVLKNFYSICRD